MTIRTLWSNLKFIVVRFPFASSIILITSLISMGLVLMWLGL